jgi:cytidylate kinase
MSRRPGGIVIAIDGPAASGKSSTARAVAAALGFRYLDSGAFYRALTLGALRRGTPVDRWPDLTIADVSALGIDAVPDDGGYRVRMHGADISDAIRAADVTALVSRMAAVPAVREWLLEILRATGRDGGLVADGRDIGTVVFPDAELKVFLICKPEERARRRLLQQGDSAVTTEQIQAETRRLVERDRYDESREVAPLTPAPDAVVLDTTDLTFDAQVAAITRLARDRDSG